MNNFQTVCRELADAFAVDKRNDGKKFYLIKDDAPAWLQGQGGIDFMHAVHAAVDGRMPDDWIYEAVHAIAGELVGHDCSSADDARSDQHEICDGLVSVYNGELLAWLASHLGNVELCDEAVGELGIADDAGMISRIGLGQYLALTRIYGAVVEALEGEATTRDEGTVS